MRHRDNVGRRAMEGREAGGAKGQPVANGPWGLGLGAVEGRRAVEDWMADKLEGRGAAG
jgi:hypothetical protein